jgi:hypothetical protein
LYLEEMDREDSPTAAEREENLLIFVSFIHGGHHTAGSPPPHHHMCCMRSGLYKARHTHVQSSLPGPLYSIG